MLGHGCDPCGSETRHGRAVISKHKQKLQALTRVIIILCAALNYVFHKTGWLSPSTTYVSGEGTPDDQAIQ